MCITNVCEPGSDIIDFEFNSVDAYPFVAFSDLTCHLEDRGIGVFWLHCAA